MKTNCSYCGEEIERIPSRVKGKNYCNASCQQKYQHKHRSILAPSILKEAHESVKQKALERFKTDPSIYRGSRGYKIINIPILAVYPFKKGKRYHHHYVWELANNKPVEKGYCVHHKDHNPLNNNIENLEYMKISEHNKLYRKLPTGKNHHSYIEGTPRIGTEYICEFCKKRRERTRYNQKCCSLKCASKKRWNP